MAEIVGIIFAGLTAMKGLHTLKITREYKTMKKSIYTMIRTGKENENFEMIVEGIEKLKKFDEINSDILTGFPKKRIFDNIKKCFGKVRTLKMEKTLELFGIETDVIGDVDKLRQRFNESIVKAEEELKTINEEEEKEQQTLSQHKVALEKIKRRQLAKNNAYRSHLDAFNLTDLLSTIHTDYVEYIESHFKVDKDMDERLKRELIKKTLLQQASKRTSSSMLI